MKFHYPYTQVAHFQLLNRKSEMMLQRPQQIETLKFKGHFLYLQTLPPLSLFPSTVGRRPPIQRPAKYSGTQSSSYIIFNK